MKFKSLVVMLLFVAVTFFHSAKLYADVVTDYSNAWKEKNSETRLKMIKTFWATDAVYQDPLTHAKGPEELNRIIGDFQKQFPDAVLVMYEASTTGYFKTWGWKITDTAHNLSVQGRDFAEFDANGKFLRLTGFFDK